MSPISLQITLLLAIILACAHAAGSSNGGSSNGGSRNGGTSLAAPAAPEKSLANKCKELGAHQCGKDVNDTDGKCYWTKYSEGHLIRLWRKNLTKGREWLNTGDKPAKCNRLTRCRDLLLRRDCRRWNKLKLDTRCHWDRFGQVCRAIECKDYPRPNMCNKSHLGCEWTAKGNVQYCESKMMKTCLRLTEPECSLTDQGWSCEWHSEKNQCWDNIPCVSYSNRMHCVSNLKCEVAPKHGRCINKDMLPKRIGPRAKDRCSDIEMSKCLSKHYNYYCLWDDLEQECYEDPYVHFNRSIARG